MSISRRISLGATLQVLRSPRQWLWIPRYVGDLMRYRAMEEAAKKTAIRYYPRLGDRAPRQEVTGFYFFQDCWAARQLFRENPEWCVDVGSTVLLVGIMAQFCRCVSVDIRPIDARLPGLEARQGSITALPFADGEVPFLTTMCVLEHIGLGRYGDAIDPLGTERAIREIDRVVKPGGLVAFSVPVGEAILEFNAHRRFRLDDALRFFPGWAVVDVSILNPTPASIDNYVAGGSGDQVACICVRKPAAGP